MNKIAAHSRAPVKLLLYRYCSSIIVAIMIVALFIYPVVDAELFESHHPAEATTLIIHIVSASDASPNIVGYFDSGEKFKANFARSGDIAPVGTSRFSGISLEKLKSLSGCQGVAIVDRSYSLYFPKLRIWALSCGSFTWTQQEGEQYFHRRQKSERIIASGGIIVATLFLLLTIFVNRRKA